MLLHPLSSRLEVDERELFVSLFMPYCAVGIHLDECGSPEERQSGDGTSFPESPDLSHVGITAASLQIMYPHAFCSHYLKVCSASLLSERSS